MKHLIEDHLSSAVILHNTKQNARQTQSENSVLCSLTSQVSYAIVLSYRGHECFGPHSCETEKKTLKALYQAISVCTGAQHL